MADEYDWFVFESRIGYFCQGEKELILFSSSSDDEMMGDWFGFGHSTSLQPSWVISYRIGPSGVRWKN